MDDKIKSYLTSCGYSLIDHNGCNCVFKNNKGSTIILNGNNIEGFLKQAVDENFVLSEGISKQILLCLLAGLGFTYFTTDLTISRGESMYPTFKNFEIIINSKFDANKLIHKDDIIKFYDYSGDRCLKRVVGVPGDTVKVSEDGLLINGHVVDKDTKWIIGKGSVLSKDKIQYTNNNDYKLDKGEYFVLGDNRKESLDSRYFGPVNETNIIRVVVHK